MTFFKLFVWGRGALAKAEKEGQREKFKVKRESLPTGYVWGYYSPVGIAVHVHTCTDYDKVALIPNGHLCRI